MAIKITEECINCGACETECPNHAIYKGNTAWTMAEGTSVNGNFTLLNKKVIDAYAEQDPLSEDYFFVVPDKCTECIGFHDEPQCASVCPVDCCITDDNYDESEDALVTKKNLLHLN